MAGIDQILSFIVQQGANELRLGSDQEPQAFAAGVRRRFAMSPTPESTLRQLLGDLLTAEREAELAEQRRVGFDHDAPGIGQFQVILVIHPDAKLEARFIHVAARNKAPRRPTQTPEPGPVGSEPAVGGEPSPAAIANAAAISSEAPRANRDVEIHCSPELLELVERASLASASDIHLADDQVPYLRVAGRLEPITGAPSVDITGWFALDDQRRLWICQGTALEAAVTLDRGQRLRVSIYRTDQGLAAALRLLPPRAPTLGELHLPMPLRDLAELPHGLVLLCGATGSGKSTTLAALCRHALENRSVLLSTLEDPIEYLLSSSTGSLVRQRQIGRDVTDFGSGLREALRADPDVIVVGELRDAETIRLALTAAETGHLVLASLHSGSAVGCVERVVDAYPSDQRAQIRVQLASCLRAVVVQRLLPKRHGDGRICALEVLRNTYAVANVIREGKTAQLATAIQAGRREGMMTLEHSLAEYVKQGLITVEQAMAAANDLEALRGNLPKEG